MKTENTKTTMYAIVEPKTGITVALAKKPKLSKSGAITDNTGKKWWGHVLERI
mgnify:CR=1 FL=1